MTWDEFERLKPGDYVEHPRFGAGTVNRRYLDGMSRGLVVWDGPVFVRDTRYDELYPSVIGDKYDVRWTGR